MTNTAPSDLRALSEVIDPDSLNRLCGSGAGPSSGSRNCRVSFRFEGCDVTVHSNGWTVVSPSRGES